MIRLFIPIKSNPRLTLETISRKLTTIQPELDLDFLKNQENINQIKEDITRRPGTKNVNIGKIIDLYNQLKSCINVEETRIIREQLLEEAIRLPNQTDPAVRNLTEPKVLEKVGRKPDANYACPKSLEEVPLDKTYQVIPACRRLLRTQRLGKITGPRTYYLQGPLAKLEQALVNFNLKKLIGKGFNLVSVPDLLHPKIINACGMNTEGDRTQVYFLDDSTYVEPVCLSGTSEMALAAFYANKIQPIDVLPLKMVATSRCYRAEVTKIVKERGLFRVHQFTKVEMFGITADETHQEGADLLNEFVSLQKELFTELGLHFQILDMPPEDLGAPAYRKIDIEAWMSGRKIFGEISSASNCTTYQSRRFGIKYRNINGDIKHCQTVNGTACAVPRMLIALAETYQKPDGSIIVPNALRPFMKNVDEIKEDKSSPKLTWLKLKS